MWRRPTGAAFWLANIGAAAPFALATCPQLPRLLPRTGIIVFRAVLLNAIPGVVGVLYRKRGQESAMVSDFAADLMLQVAAPRF